MNAEQLIEESEGLNELELADKNTTKVLEELK
jgi:hypothetical protein